MSVVKVIEILAESDVSWEAATQDSVTEAAKTVHNIQTVYVKGFQAVVSKDGKLRYRVDTKISFLVD
jgi:dodecin